MCQSTLGGEKFDAVFDMNAREVSDTKCVAEVFKGKVDHYVFMSSAGVYLKSELMPHREVSARTGKRLSRFFGLGGSEGLKRVAAGAEPGPCTLHSSSCASPSSRNFLARYTIPL